MLARITKIERIKKSSHPQSLRRIPSDPSRAVYPKGTELEAGYCYDDR